MEGVTHRLWSRVRFRGWAGPVRLLAWVWRWSQRCSRWRCRYTNHMCAHLTVAQVRKTDRVAPSRWSDSLIIHIQQISEGLLPECTAYILTYQLEIDTVSLSSSRWRFQQQQQREEQRWRKRRQWPFSSLPSACRVLSPCSSSHPSTSPQQEPPADTRTTADLSSLLGFTTVAWRPQQGALHTGETSRKMNLSADHDKEKNQVRDSRLFMRDNTV